MHQRLTSLLIIFFATATLLITPPAGAVETPASADRPTEESSSLGSYGTAAQNLINQGMEYLGIRYRFGGSSPETGLDCSGLVQNVFRNALGLDLPRAARDMAKVGDKVGIKELKPGDLVFFNTMRKAFSHVGIYVGDGRFLHAPSSGGEVRIDEMSQSYWAKRFNGARRMVPEGGDLHLPQAN
ncbi:C40 family peptidase [Aromatoleum evansii]|uniref:C40 family peptidase n=1 Tax=Aromatoleum evansii TaxID=59406 RepID=A0ABZ1AGX0_AROEV|nr:C40 family peptidase [Aromatoleum evansii]NMG30412.1 glycoside hydrolase [Aromatoleum evansii]WRL45122.1 C40 family peptidase [Aromatoleum evansii]